MSTIGKLFLYSHRKKDRLYLEAICKVIRPDFIINLNQQRIDFGNCLVGMKVVKTVKLQNITCKQKLECLSYYVINI